VISTGALWNFRPTLGKNCGEKRGVAREPADLCAQNALKFAREFEPLISCARNIFAAAKNAEKLAIRKGRCCLFSVICADF
jgi:hypothetical protein